MNKGEIKIFQSNDGVTEIQTKFENDTVWLTQEQISLLFWVDRTVITKHINNIFKSDELGKNQVCAKNAHTASDWKIYQTNFYNLDMIISVWYRVNSKQATNFRIWSTSILKDYLIKWYSINKRRLEDKWLQELEQTMKLFKNTLGSWNLWKEEALEINNKENLENEIEKWLRERFSEYKSINKEVLEIQVNSLKI